MAKQAVTAKKEPVKHTSSLFETDNIKWMILGGVVLILGLLLMAGGKSKDPNVFDPSQLYSIRRVTIAPLLVVGGLIIEIYAIMKKPKSKA